MGKVTLEGGKIYFLYAFAMVPIANHSTLIIHVLFQGSLSFGDVAVGFTWKEWQQLDLEQRTLYQDVMLRDCSHLLSVGCQDGKPAVIFRLEQEKGPWMEEEEEMGTWHFPAEQAACSG
ncbi:hypothetical protein P7K49_003457 [Saguinus oedipus]|uniref:KRAB domain-containing protein n=1 Tax=Saguinus oedipus TaxID=9490 RepID=A0ABQ9W5B4_SAGOE|nr:hypothetical protein P7K49_003457 [Saguinus oedipus]